MSPLVQLNPQGLYCAEGDFYVDPWLPVENAFITHGHSDHAREGSRNYFSSEKCLPILNYRLGSDISARGVPYGEKVKQGNVWVSFHPAGHILGSAQVCIESAYEVLVVSGDYKRDPDPTCDPFEVVQCDTFITEATFGLPIYKWPATEIVAKEILDWWTGNKEKKIASVLYCYSLGKAQRILAELSKFTDETVYVHGSTENLNRIYRQEGVAFLPTKAVIEEKNGKSFSGDLILAPPSVEGGAFSKRFGTYSSGFASGWMRVRGARRRKAYDKGFVVSDHADWPSLLKTVSETKAKSILVTHGNSFPLVKHLNEQGISAKPLETAYEGETET